MKEDGSGHQPGPRSAVACRADPQPEPAGQAGDGDFVNPTAYSLSLTGNSSASTSGNETLQCRGSVAPAPSSLEFYSGFPCYLPQTQDWTSNSQLTLRTNGTASLTCKGK